MIVIWTQNAQHATLNSTHFLNFRNWFKYGWTTKTLKFRIHLMVPLWSVPFFFCLHVVFQRVFFVFFFAFFFRAAPVAYGGFQARVLIGAVAMPEPEQRGIQAMSATYITAHGNAASLTHWAGPEVEPSTSWLLVRFVSTVPQGELSKFYIKQLFSKI